MRQWNTSNGQAEPVDALRKALAGMGFRGEFESGLGARQVASTDNSIYEILPAAIIYPIDGMDVDKIVQAAIRLQDQPLSLTARGGNTGTNGQSLNDGVIVDFGRHMTEILELDVAGQTVTVQPGVVLDQLNAALSLYGLFFPPMVSTASRATIGGMVATDASGKGSRIYGKTSDYIASMDVVLSDGGDWRVQAMPRAQALRLAKQDDVVGAVHAEALRITTRWRQEIAKVFPRMNCGLTGYNLQKVYDADTDQISLVYLLAGSEGTLALTKAITLRVIPIPEFKALAVIRYDSFEGGLRDVDRLLTADPLAVELLDDKVLGVAQTDVVWLGIESLLEKTSPRPVRSLSLVEVVGISAEDVDARLRLLEAVSATRAGTVIDTTIVRDPATIRQFWSLREKAVGLLGRLGDGKQGIPFVEDTAVPPENVANYVTEFRSILDGHGLQYGMFGHLDVGCIHVRPFIDMKDPSQAALVRPISDQVAALAKRYGGLLWGEHGRGFRGEYTPLFFGPDLYPELEVIKAAFDPANLFNPGKLAAPTGAAKIDRIDEAPFRGALDRLIEPGLLAEFDGAVACNGNGQCFSWDALDTMCPSYKATRDRAQSPKGRAALLRAWARLESCADGTIALAMRSEIEIAALESLSTCLSCKACATLCPVKVDIPTLKARFLERY